MVDRKARDELADTVERYLADELTAFEFDEAIFKIADSTDDGTVDDAAWWLWSCYDDVADHKVVATKEQWDWIQRLLLVLRSDGEFIYTRPRRWTVRQPIAACGVIAFGVAASTVGLTWPLLLTCIPLGCLAYLLRLWRDRDNRKRQPSQELIAPFSSMAEMLRVHRRVRDFSKRRYPDRLRGRKIRSREERLESWIESAVVGTLFSPLALLGQSFPEDAPDYRVEVS